MDKEPIIKKRRSRKVCSHCHSRKIRCNVNELGVPCANCKLYDAKCIVRRRKNQRAEETATVKDSGNSTSAWGEFSTAGTLPTETQGYDEQVQSRRGSLLCPRPSISAGVGELSPLGGWEQPFHAAMAPSPWLGEDAVVPSPLDFSHLMDLDDVFSFTGISSVDAATFPNIPIGLETTFPDSNPQIWAPMPNTDSSWLSNGSRASQFRVPGVLPDDQEYLSRQGCFNFPPSNVIRDLMRLYFRLVHPHLPILAEDQVWSLWDGDELQWNSCSLLTLRAMMFASVGYAEIDLLTALGFSDKRAARTAFYRRAKLLFDYGVESDPVCLAQACLLLSYQSPVNNPLRVNSRWLGDAIRFARIAGAHAYKELDDVDRQQRTVLKRLWWGVLFRDHIVSLCLRRSLQVETTHDLTLRSPDQILNKDDFRSEIGKSQVYDKESQLRIIDLISRTCKLVQSLSGPCELLYRIDSPKVSITSAPEDEWPRIVVKTQQALEALKIWHDATIEQYPSPLHLDGDESPEVICLYANILFIYYATAVFALHTHLVLVHEMSASTRHLLSIVDVRQSLHAANKDIAQRIQEIVQTRLAPKLPISATPLVSPPLFLQAVNVAAARSQSSHMVAIEVRKLDIFTRVLGGLRERFEGSDYCHDILLNIIAYAQNDETFTSRINDWREERHEEKQSVETGSGNTRLDWQGLIEKRPRVFLRLMMYLDLAFCTSSPPREADFPPELRRGAI